MCDTFETNEQQAYQNIVAASVTHNQFSGQPWKGLFGFRSEALSYVLHCFALNIETGQDVNFVFPFQTDRK